MSDIAVIGLGRMGSALSEWLQDRVLPRPPHPDRQTPGVGGLENQSQHSQMIFHLLSSG